MTELLPADELRRQAKIWGFDLVPSLENYERPTLKAGDVIECRQIRPFAGDLYRPMIVRNIETHRFSAELLKGDFGEPGQTMMAFEISAHGRTWR